MSTTIIWMCNFNHLQSGIWRRERARYLLPKTERKQLCRGSTVPFHLTLCLATSITIVTTSETNSTSRMTSNGPAVRLLLSTVLLLFNIRGSLADDFPLGQGVCLPQVRTYTDSTHKEEYRVGVLAIRGTANAYTEFNKTFSEYLTATAGQRFDRPIKFTMVPLNFRSLFSDVELAIKTDGAEGVDFIYVNPSAFSCIESEYGANTLVSQISLRVVGGQQYDLTKFGGVIFARADNDEVNTVEDIRNKSVACASISGLGSGQMQFRLLQQKGLAYIQDPKQLVFTSNQGKIVTGVLEGRFDVGFVRTDQIERTKDLNGELVDKSAFKIINGGFETLDGEPFPFESSTILYPEWNVASLSHVANDVALELQTAMLAIREHAAVGADLDACLVARNCTVEDSNIFAPANTCYTQCVSEVDPDLVRCDSTANVASLALSAKKSGKYTGWRTTLSYIELRNMQEETNFIRKQDNGINACIRSVNIVDAVVCPPGHFRKQDEEVINGCADAGLDCGVYQCLCKPCVKAFDVDVFPGEFNGVEGLIGACPKFAICGRVEQAKMLTVHFVDNKEREDPVMRARVLEGAREYDLEVVKTANFTYEFTFHETGSYVGIAIFEVYADAEQIPESPFRFEVYERQCEYETGDPLKKVDEKGNCVCESGSNEIGGKCVPNSILIPSIIVPLAILLLVGVYFYVERKKIQADSVWAVKPDDLIFDDPPVILGRGTFGLVILAEYRGTQVAVKRVIPPKLRKVKKDDTTSSNWRNALLGDGDVGEFDEIPEQLQDLQFEFNTSDPKLPFNDDFDAMESGTLQKIHSTDSSTVDPTGGTVASMVSSQSKSNRRPRQRTSITGAQSKANTLFDFANYQSHSSPDVGMESGGMHKVLVQIHSETEAKPPISSRRCSFMDGGRSSLESTKGVNFEDRNDVPRATKTKRRGSDNGPTGPESIGVHRPPRRRHSLQGTPGPNFGFTSSGSQRSAVDPIESATRPCVDGLGTDDSWDYVNVADFNKMIEEEEKAVLKTVGSKSGIYSIKKDGNSGSSHIASGSNSKKQKLGFKKLKEAIFGSDEYARLKLDFVSEMRHLSKLRHPCITTVMGAVISKKSEPMLVMEYMDHGSLYDLLHNESMIVDGELVLPILRDIAQGVRFLHAADPLVIHGDLKAQNVLVDSKFRAKVADFGLSQKKSIGATGTPLWMAPELLRGDSENTAMSDVYSMGIILCEVYSRKDPYEGENHLEVLHQVADPKINKRPPVPKTCPPAMAGIMADCLGADPNNRPSFEELDLRLKRLDVENVEPGQTVFSMQKKKEQRAARNESLLFEVFPRHVAEALSDGRKIQAESFDCVTIFFSDVVGYTTISSKLHPMKVSDMLDRLYTKFDAISEEHDVFKIETIGDAVSSILLCCDFPFAHDV